MRDLESDVQRHEEVTLRSNKESRETNLVLEEEIMVPRSKQEVPEAGSLVFTTGQRVCMYAYYTVLTRGCDRFPCERAKWRMLGATNSRDSRAGQREEIIGIQPRIRMLEVEMPRRKQK
jgi:predicted Fe-S protein YdhL (DUF1289 family)